MALTPEQSDALIREVDDAVRQDDFNSFWRNYGRVVVGAVGVALLSYGGWLLWTNHQNQVAEESSETFAMMLKTASAASLDEANYNKLTKGGSTGYKAEAELVKASLASGRNDTKAAIASYAAIQADTGAPEPLRQLALVRSTALSFDNMAPQQAIDTLKDLAVPGNPWFGSAGEMTALAYLRLNKRKEAGEMFASLNRDAGVTESIRQRAGQMAGMLGVAPDTIKNIEGEN